MSKILIVEDERQLAKVLAKIFAKHNYSAEYVHDGIKGLEYLESGNYDVVVLDVMMPKMDGITMLKAMRAKGDNTPVLILSAKSEVEDKVLGLDSGGNYYLTKPFDTAELLACIRAITRSANSKDCKLTYGNLNLDRSTYELFTPFGSYKLANKEYQIMEILLSNPTFVVSSEKFMEKIWGYDSEAEINVVWVYISYLRKKLTALKSNVRIKASRNAGYYLEKKDD